MHCANLRSQVSGGLQALSRAVNCATSAWRYAEALGGTRWNAAMLGAAALGAAMLGAAVFGAVQPYAWCSHMLGAAVH